MPLISLRHSHLFLSASCNAILPYRLKIQPNALRNTWTAYKKVFPISTCRSRRPTASPRPIERYFSRWSSSRGVVSWPPNADTLFLDSLSYFRLFSPLPLLVAYSLFLYMILYFSSYCSVTYVILYCYYMEHYYILFLSFPQQAVFSRLLPRCILILIFLPCAWNCCICIFFPINFVSYVYYFLYMYNFSHYFLSVCFFLH